MKRGPRSLILLLLALPLFACQSTGSGQSSYDSGYSSAPDWYGEPLSWDKLARIETWLDGNGPARWPESVVPAELELATGRVELARRERATLPASSLRTRLGLAEAGFQRVLDHPRTNAFERVRAEEGLRSIGELERLPAPGPAAGGIGLSGIVPRAGWQAAAPHATSLRANRRPWTRITVHHSATEGDSPADVRRLQKVHMQDRGWGDVGYHFLIAGNGRIYQGRSLEWQGAHAGGTGGANNVGNIGICLLGDFENRSPDPRALRALEELVDALCQRHGIAHRAVVGHQDLRATECPGPYLMRWVRSYASS